MESDKKVPDTPSAKTRVSSTARVLLNKHPRVDYTTGSLS